ncbi:MAG: YlxR family protein [Clostridia bacterium]|nr:YlxR family protein [Clostridia bacterium]
MKMEKKVPMRTCIVCKACKPKKELNRIVKTENGFVLDKTGKLNGRGAYICDNPECINKLVKQKALNRVFKENVPDSVYVNIVEAFNGK